MPRLEGCGLSDRGQVRQNNEDRWRIDWDLGVAIVADGMGGAACGEVAAELTLETVIAHLHAAAEEDPLQAVQDAIRAAHARVQEEARERTGCGGMGSTIVLALWRLPRVIIANVGDSRAYHWRASELAQWSRDQTLVNELRANLGLSDEQLGHYAHRNILTMAIGGRRELAIHTRDETLAPGDRLLLCSDGLYAPVGAAWISSILAEPTTPTEQVEKLVDVANTAGGADNITAVLLRYGE